MTEIVARLLLLLRRRRPVFLGGVYWHHCAHRGHDDGARCWHWSMYDGYCALHNTTCYSGCEGQDDEEMKETT